MKLNQKYIKLNGIRIWNIIEEICIEVEQYYIHGGFRYNINNAFIKVPC